MLMLAVVKYIRLPCLLRSDDDFEEKVQLEEKPARRKVKAGLDTIRFPLNQT